MGNAVWEVEELIEESANQVETFRERNPRMIIALAAQLALKETDGRAILCRCSTARSP